MKRLSGLMVLVSLLVLVLGAGSAMAAMAAFTVTESSVYHSDEGYYELSFTVDNPSMDDIFEFAVGNNDAGSVWVDTGASAAPANLTKSFIAEKDGETGKWRVWTSAGYRSLTWLDDATDFAEYSRAFLYTSWGYSDNSYNGYLEFGVGAAGFTNGYGGNTQLPMSPFAAYSESGGTISGFTTTVPIPGALWLLGSGLLGLLGWRRKKKI